MEFCYVTKRDFLIENHCIQFWEVAQPFKKFPLNVLWDLFLPADLQPISLLDYELVDYELDLRVRVFP